MTKPNESEYHPYYLRYIELVPDGYILDILEYQLLTLVEIFSTINEKKALFRYEQNKWSIKELLGHLVDTERVFLYRALCISRKDDKVLPGFDQNSYVQNAYFDQQPLNDLLEQFEITRTGFIKFLKSLKPEQWNHIGNSNGKKISVRSIAYITAGHVIHHLGVLKDRYLEL